MNIGFSRKKNEKTQASQYAYLDRRRALASGPERLPARAFQLLTDLINRMPCAFPSIKTLQIDLKWSRPTVFKYLNILEKLGHIVRWTRKNPNKPKENLSNVYQISRKLLSPNKFKRMMEFVTEKIINTIVNKSANEPKLMSWKQGLQTISSQIKINSIEATGLQRMGFNILTTP